MLMMVLSVVTSTVCTSLRFPPPCCSSTTFPTPPNPHKTKSPLFCVRRSIMSSSDRIRPKALGMVFPSYLSSAQRNLMSDLLSTMEARLAPHLSDSDEDVLTFQNDSGTSQGAIDVVTGTPNSTVDFILTSWIHCKLPFGTLNITTIMAFLKSATTSAPHLIIELIQPTPTNLTVMMDLLPRKDLVLNSDDYLDHYYTKTNIDQLRQNLFSSLPNIVKPYISSSLFIRSLLSPTALAVNLECGSVDGEFGMEEVLGVHVGGVAKEMVNVWLERCVKCDDGGAGGVEEEVEVMKRRDGVIKKKAIEIDLTANLPRLFGQEVTDKVLARIQRAFGV